MAIQRKIAVTLLLTTALWIVVIEGTGNTTKMVSQSSEKQELKRSRTSTSTKSPAVSRPSFMTKGVTKSDSEISTSEPVTSASESKCRIVYKNLPAEDGRKDVMVRMKCKICERNGYADENCDYGSSASSRGSSSKPSSSDNKQLYSSGSNQEGANDKYTYPYDEFNSYASDPSVDFNGPSKAAAVNEESTARSDEGSDGGDGEQYDDSEKQDAYSDEEEEPADYSHRYDIPEEYMTADHDPEYYMSHDAAANIYHHIKFAKDDHFNDPEESKLHHYIDYEHEPAMMSSFEEMQRLLPDVAPINPDEIAPRKKMKTFTYSQVVRFGGKPNGSGAETPTDSHRSARRAQSWPNHARLSRDDEEGSDSKDCKIVYRDAPGASAKGRKERMKCKVCGGGGTSFSEDCSADYTLPNVEHEEYYNKQYGDGDAAPRQKSGSSHQDRGYDDDGDDGDDDDDYYAHYTPDYSMPKHNKKKSASHQKEEFYDPYHEKDFDAALKRMESASRRSDDFYEPYESSHSNKKKSRRSDHYDPYETRHFHQYPKTKKAASRRSHDFYDPYESRHFHSKKPKKSSRAVKDYYDPYETKDFFDHVDPDFKHIHVHPPHEPHPPHH